MSTAENITVITEDRQKMTFNPDDNPIPRDTEEPQRPDAGPGTCKVCGKPASSKYGSYCSDHKRTHDKRRNRTKLVESSTRSISDLRSDLVASFATMGMVWAMTGPHLSPELIEQLWPGLPEAQRDQLKHPGIVMGEQAEALGGSLAHLAETNPRIQRWLEVASSPSGYLAVGMAAMPVLQAAQMWYRVVIPTIQKYDAAA